MGFKVEAEYPGMMGWSNRNTLFWIGQADSKRKHHIGDVGIHHYAFRLGSRKDVDDLDTFLRDELKATIVDLAADYYEDYHAVFFLDADGLKLEGMRYGPS